MHQLEFTRVHSYAHSEKGIELPVVLRSGSNKISLVASVDTGASFCLFAGELAESLGLDLTSGEPKRFRTANSNLDTFGHEIEISTMGVVTYSMVYFFQDPFVIRNVLGRIGWLDRMRFGLIDHDSRIYLSPYDEG